MLIVTNNPLVREAYANHDFVEGAFYEVMQVVRDHLYQGHYRLLTHPLPASSRMFLTPARSIIIRSSEPDPYSMELIQQSMDNYQKTMGIRQPDFNHLADYQLLDFQLLEKAIEEQEKLDQLQGSEQFQKV
ncbi:GrdX family protein [Facklamia sp. DSM 111018]|uniref:GrdX family protein n=1 Tax=Facklamia lactis TaxID=2749967 RepID=A0ABS0LUD9_9LACT|nr:GrdX family protein [Facklamia lactis]MBG9981184.1 GrdX family protein [Facklamia lactis]MBG9986986.1 GrdX family protein [Facklamia lactis]